MAFASPRLRLRLLVAREHVVGALPGREEVELPEFLSEPDRLVDDALLLVVVANLDEAGQREILAQRVPLEAVVGEDAAQVRVAGEQDAVEVVGLALEPVGAGKNIDERRAPASSSSVCDLHADAPVVLGRQQVVDDVEALLARRDSRRRRYR